MGNIASDSIVENNSSWNDQIEESLFGQSGLPSQENLLPKVKELFSDFEEHIIDQVPNLQGTVQYSQTTDDKLNEVATATAVMDHRVCSDPLPVHLRSNYEPTEAEPLPSLQPTYIERVLEGSNLIIAQYLSSESIIVSNRRSSQRTSSTKHFEKYIQEAAKLETASKTSAEQDSKANKQSTRNNLMTMAVTEILGQISTAIESKDISEFRNLFETFKDLANSLKVPRAENALTKASEDTLNNLIANLLTMIEKLKPQLNIDDKVILVKLITMATAYVGKPGPMLCVLSNIFKQGLNAGTTIGGFEDLAKEDSEYLRIGRVLSQMKVKDAVGKHEESLSKYMSVLSTESAYYLVHRSHTMKSTKLTIVDKTMPLAEPASRTISEKENVALIGQALYCIHTTENKMEVLGCPDSLLGVTEIVKVPDFGIEKYSKDKLVHVVDAIRASVQSQHNLVTGSNSKQLTRVSLHLAKSKAKRNQCVIRIITTYKPRNDTLQVPIVDWVEESRIVVKSADNSILLDTADQVSKMFTYFWFQDMIIEFRAQNHYAVIDPTTGIISKQYSKPDTKELSELSFNGINTARGTLIMKSKDEILERSLEGLWVYLPKLTVPESQTEKKDVEKDDKKKESKPLPAADEAMRISRAANILGLIEEDLTMPTISAPAAVSTKSSNDIKPATENSVGKNTNLLSSLTGFLRQIWQTRPLSDVLNNQIDQPTNTSLGDHFKHPGRNLELSEKIVVALETITTKAAQLHDPQLSRVMLGIVKIYLGELLLIDKKGATGRFISDVIIDSITKSTIIFLQDIAVDGKIEKKLQSGYLDMAITQMTIGKHLKSFSYDVLIDCLLSNDTEHSYLDISAAVDGGREICISSSECNSTTKFLQPLFKRTMAIAEELLGESIAKFKLFQKESKKTLSYTLYAESRPTLANNVFNILTVMARNRKKIDDNSEELLLNFGSSTARKLVNELMTISYKAGDASIPKNFREHLDHWLKISFVGKIAQRYFSIALYSDNLELDSDTTLLCQDMIKAVWKIPGLGQKIESKPLPSQELTISVKPEMDPSARVSHELINLPGCSEVTLRISGMDPILDSVYVMTTQTVQNHEQHRHISALVDYSQPYMVIHTNKTLTLPFNHFVVMVKCESFAGDSLSRTVKIVASGSSDNPQVSDTLLRLLELSRQHLIRKLRNIVVSSHEHLNRLEISLDAEARTHLKAVQRSSLFENGFLSDKFKEIDSKLTPSVQKEAQKGTAFTSITENIYKIVEKLIGIPAPAKRILEQKYSELESDIQSCFLGKCITLLMLHHQGILFSVEELRKYNLKKLIVDSFGIATSYDNLLTSIEGVSNMFRKLLLVSLALPSKQVLPNTMLHLLQPSLPADVVLAALAKSMAGLECMVTVDYLLAVEPHPQSLLPLLKSLPSLELTPQILARLQTVYGLQAVQWSVSSNALLVAEKVDPKSLIPTQPNPKTQEEVDKIHQFIYTAGTVLRKVDSTHPKIQEWLSALGSLLNHSIDNLMAVETLELKGYEVVSKAHKLHDDEAVEDALTVLLNPYNEDRATKGLNAGEAYQHVGYIDRPSKMLKKKVKINLIERAPVVTTVTATQIQADAPRPVEQASAEDEESVDMAAFFELADRDDERSSSAPQPAEKPLAKTASNKANAQNSEKKAWNADLRSSIESIDAWSTEHKEVEEHIRISEAIFTIMIQFASRNEEDQHQKVEEACKPKLLFDVAFSGSPSCLSHLALRLISILALGSEKSNILILKPVEKAIELLKMHYQELMDPELATKVPSNELVPQLRQFVREVALKADSQAEALLALSQDQSDIAEMLLADILDLSFCPVGVGSVVHLKSDSMRDLYLIVKRTHSTLSTAYFADYLHYTHDLRVPGSLRKRLSSKTSTYHRLVAYSLRTGSFRLVTSDSIQVAEPVFDKTAFQGLVSRLDVTRLSEKAGSGLSGLLVAYRLAGMVLLLSPTNDIAKRIASNLLHKVDQLKMLESSSEQFSSSIHHKIAEVSDQIHDKSIPVNSKQVASHAAQLPLPLISAEGPLYLKIKSSQTSTISRNLKQKLYAAVKRGTSTTSGGVSNDPSAAPNATQTKSIADFNVFPYRVSDTQLNTLRALESSAIFNRNDVLTIIATGVKDKLSKFSSSLEERQSNHRLEKDTESVESESRSGFAKEVGIDPASKVQSSNQPGESIESVKKHLCNLMDKVIECFKSPKLLTNQNLVVALVAKVEEFATLMCKYAFPDPSLPADQKQPTLDRIKSELTSERLLSLDFLLGQISVPDGLTNSSNYGVWVKFENLSNILILFLRNVFAAFTIEPSKLQNHNQASWVLQLNDHLENLMLQKDDHSRMQDTIIKGIILRQLSMISEPSNWPWKVEAGLGTLSEVDLSAYKKWYFVATNKKNHRFGLYEDAEGTKPLGFFDGHNTKRMDLGIGLVFDTPNSGKVYANSLLSRSFFASNDIMKEAGALLMATVGQGKTISAVNRIAISDGKVYSAGYGHPVIMDGITLYHSQGKNFVLYRANSKQLLIKCNGYDWVDQGSTPRFRIIKSQYSRHFFINDLSDHLPVKRILAYVEPAGAIVEDAAGNFIFVGKHRDRSKYPHGQEHAVYSALQFYFNRTRTYEVSESYTYFKNHDPSRRIVQIYPIAPSSLFAPSCIIVDEDSSTGADTRVLVWYHPALSDTPCSSFAIWIRLGDRKVSKMERIAGKIHFLNDDGKIWEITQIAIRGELYQQAKAHRYKSGSEIKEVECIPVFEERPRIIDMVKTETDILVGIEENNPAPVVTPEKEMPEKGVNVHEDQVPNAPKEYKLVIISGTGQVKLDCNQRMTSSSRFIETFGGGLIITNTEPQVISSYSFRQLTCLPSVFYLHKDVKNLIEQDSKLISIESVLKDTELAIVVTKRFHLPLDAIDANLKAILLKYQTAVEKAAAVQPAPPTINSVPGASIKSQTELPPTPTASVNALQPQQTQPAQAAPVEPSPQPKPSQPIIPEDCVAIGWSLSSKQIEYLKVLPDSFVAPNSPDLIFVVPSDKKFHLEVLNVIEFLTKSAAILDPSISRQLYFCPDILNMNQEEFDKFKDLTKDFWEPHYQNVCQNFADIKKELIEGTFVPLSNNYNSRSAPQKLFSMDPENMAAILEFSQFATLHSGKRTRDEYLKIFCPMLVHNYYYMDYISRLPVFGGRCIDPLMNKINDENILGSFFMVLLRPDDQFRSCNIACNGQKARLETRLWRQHFSMLNQWTYGQDDVHGKLLTRRGNLDRIRFELIGEGRLNFLHQVLTMLEDRDVNTWSKCLPNSLERFRLSLDVLMTWTMLEIKETVWCQTLSSTV